MHTILIWFARFFCFLALIVFHGHFHDQNPWLSFLNQPGSDVVVPVWQWRNLVSLGYGALMLIPILFLAASFDPSRRLLQRWSGGESFPWLWGVRASGLYFLVTAADPQSGPTDMATLGVRIFLLALGASIIFLSYPAGWHLVTRWVPSE